jgi:hypothetical protein
MPQAGVAFDLASFKNSREYARKATTTAVTDEMLVNGNGALLPSLIAPADPNRTYITLRNLNSSTSYPAGTSGIKYFYQHALDPAPTIAQILSEGFELDAGEAIDLESPESVWAVSLTVTAVPVVLDTGTG